MLADWSSPAVHGYGCAMSNTWQCSWGLVQEPTTMGKYMAPWEPAQERVKPAQEPVEPVQGSVKGETGDTVAPFGEACARTSNTNARIREIHEQT